MKVQRQSLAGQVVAVILDRITTGCWAIGTKLPGEATLAAELGVGRSTVREAIRDLAGRGVLSTRQGAGVFVTASTPAVDWPDVLRRAAITEVVEGRLAVETEAAYRAAQRRTAADLDALERALAVRADAERSAEDAAFVEADLDFHQAVVTAAGNEVLNQLFRSFQARIRTAMIDMLALFEPADQRGRQTHDSHAAIVAAIRDRDPERAAALSRAHLEEMHRSITGQR